MNKENLLFGICGLLLGLIVGFIFANSVNKTGGVTPVSATGMPQQSANLPPGHPEVADKNGQSGANMPEVQAAIDKAKQEPDNFDAQMKAAEVYYEIGRYEGAVEFLKKANQLKPDDYDLLVTLGNATFDSNQYVEAEKWYSAALAKKADDVNVRTDLGLTFIFRDPPNYDRAIQEFQRSLEKDPNHTQTLQNLTVAYTKKGDKTNAEATLAKLESVDAKNNAIAKLREDIQKMEIK